MEDAGGCAFYGLIIFTIIVALFSTGDSGSNKPDSERWHGSRPYNRHVNMQRLENKYAEKERKRKEREEYLERMKTVDFSKVSSFRLTPKESKKTPDDAYDEGYDEGRMRGEQDRLDKLEYRANYDDGTSYYDYYESKYQEGYEEGYYYGYSYGN